MAAARQQTDWRSSLPGIRFLAGSEEPTDEEKRLLRCFVEFCVSESDYCPDLLRHRSGLWSRTVRASLVSSPESLTQVLAQIASDRETGVEWQRWRAVHGL